MTKKIKCQAINEPVAKELKVTVIQSPLLKKDDLRNLLMARAKALVI